ncbi:MAG: hypothetical protein GY953_36315 [bacterium]|nr:hypothetical protein [bacterium]
MATLVEVIQRVRNRQTGDSGWLYIACAPTDLTLGTEAELGCPEFDEETGEEIAPPGFAERGLQSTIDVATVSDCIEWADRLSGTVDDAAALDIIRYYIRFDAWPDTLDAPDPPSPEESLRRSDREFADNLGPEGTSKECRRDVCRRGVVKFSVLCRRHHFESVQKRPYPFSD